MTVWDELKGMAAEVEQTAEDRHEWDAPSIMWGVMRRDDGRLHMAMVPLAGMHPHPPSAMELFAQLVEQRIVPSEAWDSTRVIALMVSHEAWMRDSETDLEFEAFIEREGGAKDVGHFDELRERFYGTRDFEDIPGSIEMRMVTVVMGQRVDMLARPRHGKPYWFMDKWPSDDPDHKLSGRMVDSMRAILAATRGT